MEYRSWKVTRKIIQQEVDKRCTHKGDLKKFLATAGVTYSTYYHHIYDAPEQTEEYNMSLDFLVGIASALGVSLNYLLTGETDTEARIEDKNGTYFHWEDLLCGIPDAELPELYSRFKMVADWYKRDRNLL